MTSVSLRTRKTRNSRKNPPPPLVEVSVDTFLFLGGEVAARPLGRGGRPGVTYRRGRPGC
jgi:hypothetical protein